MKFNHICPYCKRYIGLWNKEGNLIAYELHLDCIVLSKVNKPMQLVEIGRRLFFI